jgi:hypothetical protein
MAEDFKNIDQIIRQKFENFEPEPPLHLWENIKPNIPKQPDAPSSPGILLPIIVTVSLLFFIGGLFNHYYNNQADQENPEAEKTYSTIQTAGVISAGSTSNSDLSQETPYEASSQVPVIQDIPVQTNEKKVVADIPVRVPFKQTAATEKKQKPEKSPGTTITAKVPAGEWRPGIIKAVSIDGITYADAIRYDLSPRDVRKLSTITEKKRKPGPDWSIGAYFNPEISSYSDQSLENSIGYNIAILPKVSFSNFFLQSGINARFTHDKGNCSVDYNRYLGTYEDVYEVTFDTTEDGVIPIYHTQTVEVYDTVNHYNISETKARYTYLEIPLYFGYRYSFGKIGLFAQAGPAASFMIWKDIPEAGSPEEKARIVNVNSPIPVRSTVNWQLMMGAGFDYQFGDKFSFSLEPTFRYALKPEFTLPENNSGRTMSFGVRAGLNYKF